MTENKKVRLTFGPHHIEVGEAELEVTKNGNTVVHLTLDDEEIANRLGLSGVKYTGIIQSLPWKDE